MAAGGSDRDPLLRTATRIAAYVFIALSVFVVVAQVVGRFINPTFDVGDLVVSGIFGTLLAILGIGAGIRFLNGGGR